MNLFSWRERDPVDEQLRDIARQGSTMARLAHACAFLLIVLFSAGSLVALSGEALVHLATVGIRPATIPAAISVAVSTLLVVCMDTAMLYAASMLRILQARRADASEQRIHIAVLIVACILEATTYGYMAALYDLPTSVAAWALVAARALAAPLFSVYLSMARPLPVGPRDILYQVELATGRGVIRDAVTVANDTDAPLERKMALYGASAVMVDADRARLENMIGVLQSGVPSTDEQPPMLPPPDPQTPPDDDEWEDSPYTTGEWPSLRMVPGRSRPSRNERRKMSRMRVLRDEAFGWLDGDPTMSRKQLRDLLHCRQETANGFYAQWQHAQRQVAHQ